MRIRASLALLSAVWPTVAIATEFAAAVPHVADFTHSGNGCPQSSTVDRAGDFNGLAFTFETFATESSDVVNCAVHFNVDGASPGSRVGLRRVTVESTEVLPPGSSLESYVQAFWSREATDTSVVFSPTLNNSGSSAIMKRVVLDHDFVDEVVWSPCADDYGYLGIFTTNFRVILTGGAKFGGKPVEQLEWVWEQC